MKRTAQKALSSTMKILRFIVTCWTTLTAIRVDSVKGGASGLREQRLLHQLAEGMEALGLKTPKVEYSS